MKSLNGVAVVAAWSALAVGGTAFAQEAVQWRVEDGGNGHWYQVVRQAEYICWSASQDAAELRGGHLATISTSAEDGFVKALAGAVRGVPAAEHGPWIGLSCANVQWGQWYWVTGEPVSYQAWPGWAPNPGWGEEYVNLWRYGTLEWNDYFACGGGNYSYVIEWSADCNGDGIVDYGQILLGELADANANGVPDICECDADINEDGVVNGADISVLLGYWGQSGKNVVGDITGDGIVNGADLAQLLGSWGECP